MTMIVAELSANAGISLLHAMRLVDAAKQAGADMIKLQAYSAESITIDHDGPGFVIAEGPWAGRKLIDLYREAATSREIFAGVFAYCKKVGIGCFSSVFSRDDISFADAFDPPFHKIASFETRDVGLIKWAAETGRPLIISTGMSGDQDVAEALNAADSLRTILMHCVSAYPADAANYDLGRMKRLSAMFGVRVGLSDHSLSTTLPAVAVALGAAVIEKHFCLSRADGGPDASFSMEPHEFAAMVSACREAEAALKYPLNPPREYSDLRRSLYVVEDIALDEVFTEKNIRSIRPGHGIAPKHLPAVLGRHASQDLKRGTPLSLDHIAP